MKLKYLLQRPLYTALLARFIAKGIDLFIAFILAIFFYPIGVIFAAFYLAIADSLYGGQSVGKKFIGMAVISLEDGTPCSFKQSVIRNLPFVIPFTVAIIPLWGWALAILMGIPLAGLEIYLLLKLDSGHRLGDVMADTTVIANDPERKSASKEHKNHWYQSEKIISLFLVAFSSYYR